MQIKTTTKNGSSHVPSLREVTLGHAVRILVTEVLQTGGTFDSVGTDGFIFVTDTAGYLLRGNKEEVERLESIADLAFKAGRMTADKFDPCSQKIWMLSVLRRHEFDFTVLAFDQRTTLLELADEIDQIISRHNLVTSPKQTTHTPS